MQQHQKVLSTVETKMTTVGAARHATPAGVSSLNSAAVSGTSHVKCALNIIIGKA